MNRLKMMVLLLPFYGIKVLYTVGVDFMPEIIVLGNNSIFLGIPSVFYSLAGMYHEELRPFLFPLLVTVAALWIIVPIIAIFGIWFKKMRVISVELFTAVNVVDLVFSFLISDFVLKTLYVATSSITVGISCFVLWRMICVNKKVEKIQA